MLKHVYLIFILVISYNVYSKNITDGNSKVNVFLEDNYISVKFNLDDNSQGQGLLLDKTLGKRERPYKSILVEGKPESIKINILKNYDIYFTNNLPKINEYKKYRCGSGIKYTAGNVSRSETLFYEIEGLGDFRGIFISRVKMYPTIYNSKEHRTLLYPKIEYQIFTSKNNLINYDGLKETMNMKYLIITPSKFHDEFLDYAYQKSISGLEVDIVDLEDMGKTFAEIKKSIKERYLNLQTRFSFALLVGHENLFPTEYVRTSSNDHTPSDINYFLFGGKGDIIPDVLYSRLTVKDSKDIKTQLHKFIEFEEDKYFANKIIGVASSEGENPSDLELMNKILSPYKNIYNIGNFFENEQGSSPNNLVNEFKNDLKWIFYLGHGTGTMWASFYGGNFTPLHIRKISGQTSRPIIIDISCSNGKYSINRFGERFMNSSSRELNIVGAASYYGGSARVSWMAPAIMGQGISKSTESSETLGELILKGKLYLLNNYSDLSEIKDTFMWFNLQGDATLNIKSE